ncbi:uncharacterized protein LOC122660147 isoform X1 [Telopea speciosissima]|uniref:uncharacterized protein LOC122660147 isoform X1 n=2 Tax=Telopea speciosissima TaxID=54955 RepID=UPI001CC74B50|nr:uncharacterized protein LOC122660147 isoform X1 [Telopea speciosissima]
MAISGRNNRFLPRLQAVFLNLKRRNCTLSGEGKEKSQSHGRFASVARANESLFDNSTWRAFDSRSFGISRPMIPSSTWTVLKILQRKGFEAYLVGGCVRDLVLRRTPKDFDVITTAKLKQIKKQFNRAWIVGRRFPICLVNIHGSVIEVSSFETVAERAKEEEMIFLPQMFTNCDKKDYVRWRDCLHRDFTINSLFFDPFVSQIYDYADGLKDLKTGKVRTVIPAQLSFKEDCARILRGIRIAARLGLSFSEETAEAIQNLGSSILSLDKQRLMMELNFMLSYGAAESSFILLWRFKLLGILLPVHAAYLAQQADNQSAQNSVMLMKLFFNVDKLLACDRPSDCSLWIGLLAFHLALVDKPQDALVVWAFCSVLYHGSWKEAVKCARENALEHVQFKPEILQDCITKSDQTLAEEVSHLASLVQSSVDSLTDPECLLKSMARYPLFPCSGLVFISKRMGEVVAGIFDVLLNDVESYKNERENFEVHCEMLGRGDWNEIRFVLGKVIMETMSSGITQKHQPRAINDEHCILLTSIKQQQQSVEEKWLSTLTGLEEQSPVAKEKEQHFLLVGEKGECCQRVVKETENHSQEVSKKKRIMKAIKEEICSQDAVKEKAKKHHQEVVKEKNKRKYIEAVKEENIYTVEVVKKQQKYHQEASKKQKLCQEATWREVHQQEVVKAKADHHPESAKDKKEKDQSHLYGLEKQQEKQCRPLSSLFR